MLMCGDTGMFGKALPPAPRRLFHKTAASTSSSVVLERKEEYWKIGCCNIILKKLVGSSGQLVHLDEDKPEQLIDNRQLHALETLHPDE